eukprot:CAMPEP_0176156314 /NCGR_PEP_ID=MMETSP0120_2-20121206/79900_1 /TAXON_ID=160619 /ORGANISM="Kryptoperidinium foliaceum, Strain CCMP 1326" /LENGTH=42 /DNA_ID= /DNA_START= /DNA_END= /DNA_ORIENTATION=
MTPKGIHHQMVRTEKERACMLEFVGIRRDQATRAVSWRMRFK